MFKTVIQLLTTHIRVLIEHQNDKTGVISQYSKDQAAKTAKECERAIIALNHTEAKSTSTSNSSDAISASIAWVKSHENRPSMGAAFLAGVEWQKQHQ